MASSLAAQLAQGASLNATLLADRSRRKPIESYLFTGREANQHDLESIHALASNGLIQLRALDKRFGTFGNSLFSDASKTLDRTLQNKEANARLNEEIEQFMGLLSPFLMEAPAGKVMEWLVRRFRVNEFNVDALIATFLPYHEAPHFTKMLSILHILTQSTHAYLLPSKSSTLPVARETLVTAMLKHADVLRFVVSLLPSALERGTAHRALISFNTVIILELLGRPTKTALNEGSLATLIPALTAPFTFSLAQQATAVHRDAMVGSYMLLAALSQKTRLTSAAIHGIMAAMAAGAIHVSMKTFMRSAASLCSPQESVDSWSRSVYKTLSHQSSFNKELLGVLAYAGSEKLVQPFLSILVSELPSKNAAEILADLTVLTQAPTSLIHHLARCLIRRCVGPKDNDGDKTIQSEVAISCRQLLVTIQQRHPRVLEKSVQELCADEEFKEPVEQIIMSLSVIPAHSADGANVDLVLASVNADANVRAIAVRDMHKLLSSNKINAEEAENIRSALWTRLHDSSQTVIDALYAEPSKLIALFSTNVTGYIVALADIIHPQPPISTPARSIIRAHLDFLVSHLLLTPTLKSPDLDRLAFEKVIFPLLLLSKPRLKTARAAWATLELDAASGGLAALPLVAAALESYSWEGSRSEAAGTLVGKRKRPEAGSEPEISIETMARTNIAVAARMSEVIVSSDEYESYLSFVLQQLQASSPHARALAYLIIRSLLGTLGGERQIDAARRALAAMELNSFEELSGFMAGVDNLQSFIDDATLGVAVVLKPNSKTTLSRLQAATLALVPLIPRPNGVSALLLATEDAEDATVTTRYVNLMRRVYTMANSTDSLALLSRNFLRALFITLADDTLAFLAGIWLTTPQDEVAHAALCHSVAFFAAHGGMESPVDFQTVLPALLVVLESSNKNIREAAAECVVLMSRMAGAKKAASIYAIDSIYGDSSDKIQFLEWVDFGRYLNALVEHKDHLLSDPTYLPALHRHHLSKQKGDGKKDAAYKQRVICYLLSHASATSLPRAQIGLYQVLSEVSTPLKVQMLLDAIQWVCQTSREIQVQKKAKFAEEHAVLLISNFDASACQTLNEPASPSWPILLNAVTQCYKPGFFETASAALSRRLEHGLYAGLKPERKVEICRLLLQTASEGPDAYSHVKQTLAKILGDVQIIIQLLVLLRPSPTAGATQRVAKRAKLDSVAEEEDSSSSLSLLAEVLASRDLPGSQELISNLLETLGALVHLESGNEDNQYIEQLLMSALETTASKISNLNGLKPSSIRVDLLVDLIRSADNPQTFNQALLLVATLARLWPDSVLHNIMPIFTFMGSNVFHRDDAYSFQVVQKTIDSIAPVMVSSIRERTKSRLETQIQAGELLRIFTDAAHHIPRHRRTNFFGHLVDVLSPVDFLAPTCLLIVDKVGNRILRQDKEDVRASLSLALSILQRYSVTTQVQALNEVLQEAERHVLGAQGSDTTMSFLNTNSEDDNGVPKAISLRRIQAVVLFVGHALDNSPAAFLADPSVSKDDLTSLVSTLLQLVSLPLGGSRPEYDQIAKVSKDTLTNALTLMSTADFLGATLKMIKSPDQSLRIGALALISQLLPNVSAKARVQVTGVVNDITELVITDMSGDQHHTPLVVSYAALKAIAVTMSPGEEGVLMKCVPMVLSSIRTRTDAPAALALLRPLVPKLGPRMIPHFHALVEECVSFLRDESGAAVWDDALGVLSALLQAIPTFWGKNELITVLKLFVEDKTPQPALSTFVRALTKRVPSKTLLPTLCDAWTTLQISGPEEAGNRTVAYFQVMKRALHAAPRADISENLRSLFKIFTDGFDRRHAIESWDDDEAESQSITAFIDLVVKLNEATFRPLFRKLFDWAFATSSSDKNHYRALTFCRVYEALLDYFKGLMTTYMSFLIQPFMDLLESSAKSDAKNDTLWLGILITLTKSLQHDEGAFWRADKLRQIAAPLVAQVATCIKFGSVEGKTVVSDSLVALADAISDDDILKSINMGVLMHTRSEEVLLRMFALDCAEKLWKAHGGKLLGFVPETVGFMAECAEDENDTVVQNAHKLKAAVESVAGSVHGL